jgi:starch-binding outer membrane protein, SusD/RagB family
MKLHGRRRRLVSGIWILALAAAVTFACQGFLDVPAQGVVDDDAMANRVGVEGALVAAYRTLDCASSYASNWGCAASNWGWASIASGDAYRGSDGFDYSPFDDVELYYWESENLEYTLDGKWRQAYEGVARANAALRLLAKTRREKPGEIRDADAAGIRGEALFLRAHYHFEGYRMWANIPYYHEHDTDFYKTNVGVDVIGELLSDLDSAIALLPVTPRNGDKGRVTSWAARAYKGRVQAYARDWAGALTTLRDVRANGPFALEMSFDHVWTGFAQYQSGPETILAYQASVNDGEPNGFNSNWGERLNFPHSGSPFGCCGYHQPSQNLVNFFAVDAGGLPLAVSDPNWNALDTNLAAGSPTPVDPRLDWTVGRDGVPYKDWGLHDSTWIRGRSRGGPYSPKKNIHERSSGSQSSVGWNPASTNDVNIHLFRYADMLLLLAEAEVEAGVLENARAIVNDIRARAGRVAQGCGSADSVLLAMYPACAGDLRIAVPLVHNATLDSLTTPWAVYRIGVYPTPWSDQAYARRAVQYERRLELAMEGQRLFDLRRWGTADTVINNYLAVEKNRRYYLASAEPFTARHYLYPIPEIEIEMSRVGGQDRLVQNPGW